MIDLKDIELLEYAAKAAGYKKYYPHYLGRDSFVTYDEEVYSEVKEKRVVAEKTLDWNPLTDDGDALRLAVKLGLAVSIDSVEQETWAHHEQAFKGSSEKWKCCPTSNNGDEDGYAATRRAIVMAAAEIGRNMK